MGLVISALVVNVFISLIIPLVILVVLWIKYPMERKGIVLLSLAGILSYMGMQWGCKEHSLSYLFNHTDFQQFMDAHYIPYLLFVAFFGALMALLPALLIAIVCCKRQISYRKVVAGCCIQCHRIRYVSRLQEFLDNYRIYQGSFTGD